MSDIGNACRRWRTRSLCFGCSLGRLLNGECLLAVRSGTWKYIPALGSGGWGSGGDQSQPVQLHNLADDLGETKNLAVAMPDKSLK